MLAESWDETETYRDFFKAVANVDCILLQVWLEIYINDLLGKVNLSTSCRWRIKRKSINEWQGLVDKITRTKNSGKLFGGNNGKEVVMSIKYDD